MNGYRRHGTSLAEILFMLPIIAMITSVVFQITSRAMRMETRIVRQTQADAGGDDLVRRIQRDAGCARGATIERSDTGVVLALRDCRIRPNTGDDGLGEDEAGHIGSIVYRVAGGKVTRMQRIGDGPASSYQWTFEAGDVDLALESIDQVPRIVWVRLIQRQAPEQGPDVARWLAASALVGQGGVR